MKIWHVLLLSFFLLLFAGCHADVCVRCVDEAGLFIHVSHGADEPHRTLMAFQMANLMADAGTPVLVYCDINAVNVVLKDSADISFSHFDSSRAALEALLAKGVTVVVCPGCLKAKGKTPDDVMDGVAIASKEAFFGFTKGRILTLDY